MNQKKSKRLLQLSKSIEQKKHLFSIDKKVIDFKIKGFTKKWKTHQRKKRHYYVTS